MFFNFLFLASALVNPIDPTREIDELRVPEGFIDEEIALVEEFNDDLGELEDLEIREFLLNDELASDDFDN